MAEVLIVLLAIAFQIKLPLLAIQILWLNLITDGFLNLAISMEPKRHALQNVKLSQSASLVDKEIIFRMLYMATPMALGSLAVFVSYVPYGIAKARTMVLITMALFQLFNAWNVRFEHVSIFNRDVFNNKYLSAVSLFVLFLQYCIVTLRPMQNLFRTVSLCSYDWILIILVSSTIIFFEELRKLYLRKWVL